VNFCNIMAILMFELCWCMVSVTNKNSLLSWTRQCMDNILLVCWTDCSRCWMPPHDWFTGRYDHVTPLLKDLHWLRVPERISFHLAVLVYRCQHGIVPPYLANELHRVADVESRQRLHSTTTALVVPNTVHSTIGDRSFPVAAVRVWNSLPQHVTSSPSLTFFRRRLKTELFTRSYDLN